MNTEDETALAMVRLGYALDDPSDEKRCLNFRVGFLDHGAAMQAVRAIEAYNEFDGEVVAGAIQRITMLDSFARIEIGREGSPVMYVTSYGKAEEIAAILNGLSQAHPDECDIERHTVRAWWD